MKWMFSITNGERNHNQVLASTSEKTFQHYSAAQGRLMPLAFAAHSPFAAGSRVRFPLCVAKAETLSSGFIRY